MKFFDWLKKTVKWITINLTKFAIVDEIFHNTVAVIINASTIVSQVSLKITMSNNITIYDDSSTYNRIFTIIDAYFNVWKSTNEIVNVFKNQWMIIFILFDAKSNSAKIYSHNFQNKKFVDEKFDRLHKQKKLNWTNEATSYAYFCFVVWKTINIFEKSLERKNKMIINIKNLNKISMFDAYFMTQ